MLLSETWNDHGLVEGGMTAEISVAPAECRRSVGFLDGFEVLEQGGARFDTAFFLLFLLLAFMLVDPVFACFCRRRQVVCIFFSFPGIWSRWLALQGFNATGLTGIRSRLWRSWSMAFSCGGRILPVLLEIFYSRLGELPSSCGR